MADWTEKIKHNHGLMMVLCCGVPLVLLLAGVYFFGLSKIYLTWFVILLCPLMHIFMMRDMHKGHKEDAGDGDPEEVHEHDKKGKGGCH